MREDCLRESLIGHGLFQEKGSTTSKCPQKVRQKSRRKLFKPPKGLGLMEIVENKKFRAKGRQKCGY